jgi:hypothetical protein
MATYYYSNHYSPAIGATGHATTLRTPMTPTAVGIAHGRLRKSVGQVTMPIGAALVDTDQIRLCDIHSNARLFDLRVSMDGNWGATATFTLGLYKKGINNTGAVIDLDCFTASVDWAAAIARTDYFVTAGLDDHDRGKQVWELANITLAASTYSAATDEMWSIVATANATLTTLVAAVEMICEIEYTAGD